MWAIARQDPPTKNNRSDCEPILAFKSSKVSEMNFVWARFPPGMLEMFNGPKDDEFLFPTRPLDISANSIEAPPMSQTRP